MAAEDGVDLDPAGDAAADIDALEHEVQLLHQIRDGLVSEHVSDLMVDAVTGLIEERQEQLKRSRNSS